MTYQYYCTCCGHHFEAKEICFDLRDILNIEKEKVDVFIPITAEDLLGLVRENQSESRHGKRLQLTISLLHVLQYIKDAQRSTDEEYVDDITMERFSEGDFGFHLDSAANLTQEAEKERKQNIAENIKGKFLPSDLNAQENETNISDYTMEFWVEIFYFDHNEANGIDTIRYSIEENPVNLKEIDYNGQVIRGYCTYCHEPVMKFAGQYKHYLVGFLGAQSAGKTTLFVAMINELRKYNLYSKLNIKEPQPIADGKFIPFKAAMILNERGWAVKKTAAAESESSFNASVLLENAQTGHKMILTLVDIAGELCYDVRRHTVNREAFEKFPLICRCHAYLLCTCISQKGYSTGSGEAVAMNLGETELNQIINEIYNYRSTLDNPPLWPPLCRILTKIDMAKNLVRGTAKTNNPFEELLEELEEKERNSGNFYNRIQQIEHLKRIYDGTDDIDILYALYACINSYYANESKMYQSIISCAALGQQGDMYETEINGLDDINAIPYNVNKENGQNILFTPYNLDSVWEWIFRTIGICAATDDYVFSHIPSYGESYHVTDEQYQVRTDYEKDEFVKRIQGVYELYFNPSQHDEELWQHYKLYRERRNSITDGLFATKKRRALDIEYERGCDQMIHGYLEQRKR